MTRPYLGMHSQNFVGGCGRDPLPSQFPRSAGLGLGPGPDLEVVAGLDPLRQQRRRLGLGAAGGVVTAARRLDPDRLAPADGDDVDEAEQILLDEAAGDRLLDYLRLESLGPQLLQRAG